MSMRKGHQGIFLHQNNANFYKLINILYIVVLSLWYGRNDRVDKYLPKQSAEFIAALD